MQKWLKEFWKTSKGLWTFVFVAALLGGAWFLFLKLVTPPPIESVSVLIMIWGSLLVLFLAAFPKILERVKKIKAGDIELELQESITKASTENAISPEDFEMQDFFIEKGRLEELEKVVVSAMQNPKRTMIFVVNVSQHWVIAAVLAAYLYFLNFIGKPIIVVFMSMPRDDYRRNRVIPVGSIIGAIKSEQVLNQIMRNYPNVIGELVQSNEEAMREGKPDDPLNVLKGIEKVMEKGRDTLHFEYRMGREEVERWFKDTLSRRFISKNISKDDMKTLTRAIKSDDDFVFVLDGGNVVSVVPLCEYTRHFTSRVLEQD